MMFDAALRPSGTRSPDAAEPSPYAILGILLAFVLIWTGFFSITEAPVAIKHDMAEAYAWGRQFQLGYNQHPPFWAAVCGIWFRIFPRSLWAFAALSSLNAGIGLLGAWRAIGNFATGFRQRAAWALLLLTPLYTFYAYKYDANIIFISIWPWTLHFFMRSLQGRRAKDAAWLGLCVGLAMMSKYYALILVATLFLAALQHPSRRRYFASASPWLSVAIAGAIFAPHVWWAVENRAPPLHYLVSRLDWPWSWVKHYAIDAFFSVIGMNISAVVIVALARWRSREARGPADPMRGVVATLTLMPFLLTMVSGIATRTLITSEMMIGTFPLLPLLAIDLARLSDCRRLFRLTAPLAVALALGALITAPAFAWWRTWHSPAAMKVQPFQEVAAVATHIWHEKTGLPLEYVAGSSWYDNETAFYSKDRPHSFVNFNYFENLWVTPAAIARHGLLSICLTTDQQCLANTAQFLTPKASRTTVTLAHHFWGHVARPVSFVITVIPPRV
ncbi:glycosyltransferase family 39 protein [Acidisoma sp. C75]